jgi:hypothetical protein
MIEKGTEFVIATKTEAALGAESVPLDGVARVAIDAEARYRLDEIALAQLHSILLGRKYDDKVLDTYEQVYEWSEMHGPWLIRLPDDFVSALATYDLRSIQRLGRQWVRSCDAFTVNAAPVTWATNTVDLLAKLARRALQQNKNMYWQVPSC